MQQTSTQYKNAVKEINRSSAALINFGVYDVTAREDAAPVANASQPFTSPTSLTAEIRDPDYTLATFEDNYFKLDGSMYLTPDDANSVDDIIGWWSLDISDSLGEFATDPTLTINFDTPHSSLGIGLFFGYDDYCTDFDISWYNGATLLGYENITGNTQRERPVPKAIENYTQIVIRFFKTRNPYRYVRLMEIGFGLDTIFDNEQIVSASIIEEVDPSGAVLSVNKLRFTVLNTDQQFNMLNPSGVYSYLQRRQKIVAKSGLLMPDGSTYEYVALGTYYLDEWKNSTGLTATLAATDAVGLLDKTQYSKSLYWENEPVDNVIRHILNDAGQFVLSISPPAASESVSGYIPVKSHRAALMDVLMAAKCVLRISRKGLFEVFKADYTTPLDTIDAEVMLGPPAIEQLPLITSVEVKEPSYTLATSATELHKSTFNLDGTQELLINFGGRAAAEVTISVTGGTLLSSIVSAVAARVTIQAAGSVTVTINGKVYNEALTAFTASAVLNAGEVPQTASVAENKLLVGKGQSVAEHLLGYYQKRIKQTFGYWSNPALQAGDFIEVETMFEATTKKGLVEYNEIEFVPVLKGKVEVVG